MGEEEVAAWRQWPWPPLCGKKERGKENLRKTPWQFLNELRKGPTAGFNNLIKSPGQFYKFQKNSHKLDLTFRPSTKIGEVKQNVLVRTCS